MSYTYLKLKINLDKSRYDLFDRLVALLNCYSSDWSIDGDIKLEEIKEERKKK